MSGRPKPTNLKIIEGNRGKRPLPENEPKPVPKAPKCPSDIDPGAKRVWKRLAPMLERIGLLTEADGDVFACLCQVRSRLEHINRRMRKANTAIRKYQKSGQAEKLNDANKEQAFLMKEERLYAAQFRLVASDFGLTPRGRAGLSIKSDDDDGDDLLT
jgi:P27 family predicted phage terminase small subunit